MSLNNFVSSGPNETFLGSISVPVGQSGNALLVSYPKSEVQYILEYNSIVGNFGITSIGSSPIALSVHFVAKTALKNGNVLNITPQSADNTLSVAASSSIFLTETGGADDSLNTSGPGDEVFLRAIVTTALSTDVITSSESIEVHGLRYQSKTTGDDYIDFKLHQTKNLTEDLSKFQKDRLNAYRKTYEKLKR